MSAGAPEHLTREQIDRVFVAVLAVNAREADQQMLALLGATAENLADYIWDHFLGEPEEPTREQVLANVEAVLAS